MSKHSGSIWTRCASSSTSPSCGQSHGPIASSIPLRAAPLLLGGNDTDPEAQSLGACPSRGKFTRRIARHGQSDDPQSVLAQKTILTTCWQAWRPACDPCDRDRVTDNTQWTNKTGGRLPSSEPNKHANMCTCEQLGTSKQPEKTPAGTFAQASVR